MRSQRSTSSRCSAVWSARGLAVYLLVEGLSRGFLAWGGGGFNVGLKRLRRHCVAPCGLRGGWEVYLRILVYLMIYDSGSVPD